MFLQDYYFRGSTNEKEQKELQAILRNYEVILQHDFATPPEACFYDINHRFLTMLCINKREEKDVLSCSDFISLLKSNEALIRQELWWLGLEPGMEVTIDERIGTSGDYPYGFGDGMVEYAGETFTIIGKTHRLFSVASARSRRYFNGDPYSYILNIPRRDYVWHSSMFVPIGFKPVKTIELTEVQALKTLL